MSRPEPLVPTTPRVCTPRALRSTASCCQRVGTRCHRDQRGRIPLVCPRRAHRRRASTGRRRPRARAGARLAHDVPPVAGAHRAGIGRTRRVVAGGVARPVPDSSALCARLRGQRCRLRRRTRRQRGQGGPRPVRGRGSARRPGPVRGTDGQRPEPRRPTTCPARWDGRAGMVRCEAAQASPRPLGRSGYRLVLGVPIIPTRDGRAVGTLAAGAAGRYDGEFATLARTLVHYGQGDAILRLGWEFNGTWYPWSVTNTTDAAHYAAFFRAHGDHHAGRARHRRSASSGTRRRDPSPNRPRTPTPVTPTSTTSGSISTTRCGASRSTPHWHGPGTSPRPTGCSGWRASPTSHGKPAVIPEWAVTIRSDGHGLGDDPLYVGKMAQWIATHDVAFTSYFDVDAPDGQHDILDSALLPVPGRLQALLRRSPGALRPGSSGQLGPAPSSAGTGSRVPPPPLCASYGCGWC